MVKTETWGLRGLAYRMAKNRKAHYVMLDVDAPPAAIAELERQTGINEDVIRYMTIRVDAHETGPSAMMRRSERDRERGGDRGGRPAATVIAATVAIVATAHRASPAKRWRAIMARPFFRRRKSCPFSGKDAPDHRL